MGKAIAAVVIIGGVGSWLTPEFVTAVAALTNSVLLLYLNRRGRQVRDNTEHIARVVNRRQEDLPVEEERRGC